MGGPAGSGVTGEEVAMGASCGAASGAALEEVDLVLFGVGGRALFGLSRAPVPVGTSCLSTAKSGLCLVDAAGLGWFLGGVDLRDVDGSAVGTLCLTIAESSSRIPALMHSVQYHAPLGIWRRGGVRHSM